MIIIALPNPQNVVHLNMVFVLEPIVIVLGYLLEFPNVCWPIELVLPYPTTTFGMSRGVSYVLNSPSSLVLGISGYLATGGSTGLGLGFSTTSGFFS